MIIRIKEAPDRKATTAECDGVTVTDARSPITKLARLLVADHDLFETVHVMRGETLVFNPVPLWAFARVTATEPTGQSVRLVKYRADPRFAA